MSQHVDQKLALAMKDEECGPEHGKGQYALAAPEWCSRCKGTGRRYVLDPDGKLGLRVRCQFGDISTDYGNHLWPLPTALEREQRLPCNLCQGRGWIPTDDPWAWFKAVYDLLWSGRLSGRHYVDIRDTIPLGEAAFFNALAEALLGE